MLRVPGCWRLWNLRERGRFLPQNANAGRDLESVLPVWQWGSANCMELASCGYVRQTQPSEDVELQQRHRLCQPREFLDSFHAACCEELAELVWRIFVGEEALDRRRQLHDRQLRG